jgi:hypothetical protein
VHDFRHVSRVQARTIIARVNPLRLSTIAVVFSTVFACAHASNDAYDRALREGTTRYHAHDYPGAVDAYARALALNPGEDVMTYRLARASLRAQDRDAAMKWLERLAETDSDLVPRPEDFAGLAEDVKYGDVYRAIVERTKASAARHQPSVEAFRIPEKGLLAEGIAYDPIDRAFYLGSTTRRKIVRVVGGQPPFDFVAPTPEIDAIGGVRVDAARRRLWAVSGGDERQEGFNAQVRDRNAILEIDLGTGKVLGVYALEGKGHGLNDVAVDGGGRPFSTDILEGQIYTLAGDRRALVPLFDVPPFFFPNGIAFDDEGKTMFVADDIGVHVVDVAARTTRRLPVPPGATVSAIDGLYFFRGPDGAKLVGIQGAAGPGRILEATLSPKLDAITRIAILESAHPLFDGPTTGAIVAGSLYTIANSQLWVPRVPAETIILKTPL